MVAVVAGHRKTEWPFPLLVAQTGVENVPLILYGLYF